MSDLSPRLPGDAEEFGQLVNELNATFAMPPIPAKSITAENEPCWDCIKGRHAICTGRIEPKDADPIIRKCLCPVCHANMYAERQPVYDAGNDRYYDPGPGAESTPDPSPHRHYRR